MIGKYWVDYSQMEYMVITNAWDSLAGNYYNTVASGFKTQQSAQEYADKLNKIGCQLEEVMAMLNEAKDLIADIDTLSYYSNENNIDLKWNAHTILLDAISKLKQGEWINA